jgi:hypothetical protein
MPLVILIALMSLVSILPGYGADEKLLKQIHDVEIEICKNEDETAAPDRDGLRRLASLQKKLFVLNQRGRRYFADYVFKSDKLKNGFDLSSSFADDTIHVTELDCNPIACNFGDAFKVETIWRVDSLSRCDFYLGDPGQMHVDGYRGVVKLDYRGGVVHLPAKMPRRDMLLFAIVKPKSNEYFKFVFVVRPNKNSKSGSSKG